MPLTRGTDRPKNILVAPADFSLFQSGLPEMQWVSELLVRANSGEGMRMESGQADAVSRWQIVQVKRSIGSDIVVTLRSESALGVLPEIDSSRINHGRF